MAIGSETLAFGASGLDRCSNRRGDSDWLGELLAMSSTRLVRMNGDRTVVENGALRVFQHDGSGEAYLLGVDHRNIAWFAGKSNSEENLRDLRSLAVEGLLPPHELAMLAQARSIVNWHERHSFCANCGSKTQLRDAGYRRHCLHCAADHFPRTDPVVIMIVRNGDALLLGRQSTWRAGVYSALAGFMEPGETIEEAARREVMEEAGIEGHGFSYAASQPWPFPSSLMIGLIGEATTRDIRIDTRELEDARWFGAGEVEDMLAGTHESGFMAPPPMAIAHQLMRAALQSS